MKKIIKTLKVVAVVTLVQLVPLSLFANSTDDGHLTNYDSIVRDLTSTSSHDIRTEHQKDALDAVRFHFGAGMITSQLDLDTPASAPHSATLHGFEFSFAIDLFSPEWLAQTDLRAYEPENLANNQINFKEFDLLILHTTPLAGQVNWQLGGGLSARYLDFKSPIASGIDPSNSTPASVITTGLGFAATPAFGIELAASYRSRLVQNTSDAGSLDGSLRLIGHF